MAQGPRFNQPALRGYRFRDPNGNQIEVTRTARVGSWADIRVTQPNGATWTKRMPHGIPANWKRA